jgi:hypothetical protein
MFKKLTKLPLLIMSLMLVLTVSTVSAHGDGTHDTNLNGPPPTVTKIVDDTYSSGAKHIVWAHARYDDDWDRDFIQHNSVNVGDVLDWSDLNQLEHSPSCRTSHSHWSDGSNRRQSYARTAIYGVDSDLVAGNANVLYPSGGTTGDWSLSGEFTEAGDVYVYRATIGYTGNNWNGEFACVMFEKYYFTVNE